MAATYRALHQRAARTAAARSAGRAKWRNRITGAVILGALVVFAVWGAGGGMAGLGRLPVIKKLRKTGTSPEGHPIYSAL